jgi:alpha-L-fucosidase
MFIHFGLYATLERGEWVMHTEGIPPAEYQKRISTFNPSQFDARAWVDLAKSAGQRYITITSKHHEGFCMFRTETSKFGIMHSPFGRDLIGELAAECHRQNMPLFFYFSLIDWNNPAYRESLAPKTPVSAAFLDVIRTQLRELCTQYGKLRASGSMAAGTIRRSNGIRRTRSPSSRSYSLTRWSTIAAACREISPPRSRNSAAVRRRTMDACVKPA